MQRIGIGYDVHRFGGRGPVRIGGVDVPHETGLAGHSDADVLAHAICDALLGAAALPDIGRQFPDGDPAYKDISSLVLLAHVRMMLEEEGFEVVNVDAVVVCEAPRIAPHADAMRAALAGALRIAPDCVGVKATTTEGLGALGRGQGIAAQAVALIQKRGEE
jgi:2-C-methyl-D-erythritol 2,4-cyclodiphosphate synthase